MLIIAPGQEALQGYLFDFLQREGMLCVLIRIASSRRTSFALQNAQVDFIKGL